MDYLKDKKMNIYKLWVAALLTWLPFLGILLFDFLVLEPYHQIVFRLIGIPVFKRSDYILIMDREKLQYLNWQQKLGCMYCGYVNGLAAYFKAIVNRSEKYWCGIMHENVQKLHGQEYQTEMDFAEFGSEEDFKKKYKKEGK